MSNRKTTALLAGLALIAALSGCASASESGSDVKDDAGKGVTKIGFIMVGPKDDYGYNQAVYEGSQALKADFPDVEILTAENVPEDDTAATTMEQMISKGAKLIFATSYGHLDAAVKVAEKHPDVIVLQQGNTITTDVPPNMGTYFGTVYEPMYLAGIAAGASTKSDKLGYVYAFPIPQTIANINAFERGARSVNPDVETITAATGSWCDPSAQKDKAAALLKAGADVLTQHQDCTATVINTAKEAGAMTVGYHADASALTPDLWLTGAVWNWGPLYKQLVQKVIDGTFVGSEFNANYRVGFKTGTNPFVLAPYGPLVSDDTKAKIEAAKAFLATPDGSPFVGPLKDNKGKEQVAAGVVPTYAENDAMDYFVDGVIGSVK
ncbi:MAG: BMP family ABC transporter substrate-binding protein [Propionibacteriales bacterium]|nr:BMP family ABC transporter substrate-binding protein [Propionibacteriales bacterium]